MNEYRTHLCSDLTIDDLNKEVVLSGWVDTIRDHGNLLFIDLRDNYGITQCVVDSKKEFFDEISKLTNESVVRINGFVVKRSEETVNKNLNTGEIEVDISSYDLLSKSEVEMSLGLKLLSKSYPLELRTRSKIKVNATRRDGDGTVDGSLFGGLGR